MSDTFDNPYLEGTSNYRRRRIRNLLGFDSPEVYEGEAQLHNRELREVLTIVSARFKSRPAHSSESNP